MTGDFNVAVAEFAVLDESGRLTNDDRDGGHDGGRRISEQIGVNLSGEAGSDVRIWYDGAGSEGHIPVGIVGEGFDGATDPAEVAEQINADMIIYGMVEPAGEFSDLSVRVYARPQFGADFGNVVGNYDLATRIPVFDPAQPREEVWRQLDPVARAAGRLMLGLRQELLGNQAIALEHFERAVELTPESDVAHYFVGQENFYLAQAGEGDVSAYWAAAEAAFTRALELNPENARALIGQAGLHFLAARDMVTRLVAESATDPAAYEPARLEAETAFGTYGQVVSMEDEARQFSVPVGSIGRYGQAISLRLLGEIAFRTGDAARAEQFLDVAVATLEAELGRLDTANEPRLAGQYFEALGSVYEWSGYLRALREDPAARATFQQALDAFNRCRQQGEDFPFDTFMAAEIVRELCVPGVERVQQRLNGGGS
jgi:tetratricopeptide (TPR) repeat protein